MTFIKFLIDSWQRMNERGAPLNVVSLHQKRKVNPENAFECVFFDAKRDCSLEHFFSRTMLGRPDCYYFVHVNVNKNRYLIENFRS